MFDASQLNVIFGAGTFVVVQTATAFWWASKVTTRLDGLERQLTDAQNKRDETASEVHHQERSLADFGARLSVVESQIKTLSADTTEIKRMVTDLHRRNWQNADDVR